jgi:hypothetical protein
MTKCKLSDPSVVGKTATIYHLFMIVQCRMTAVFLNAAKNLQKDDQTNLPK